MAWKETERAKAALIRRTYRCEDCGHTWRVLHLSADEAVPDCERCAAAAAYVPPKPGMLTTKSKAIDYAQKMVEEDHGMTNMRDNQREGDIAAMEPSPPHTAEIEKMTRELMEYQEQTRAAGETPNPVAEMAATSGFWQNQTAVPGAAAAGTGQGADAVGLLEAGREKGISTKVRYNVVGADTMDAA